MDKIIYFGVIITCLIIFVSIFWKVLGDFRKQLKLAVATSVKVSCAGSAIPNTPREVKVQGINRRKFYDKNNNPVNPENFKKYWVKGCSMLLCGIKENDLLFTHDIGLKDILSAVYPQVYVLKRDDYVRHKVAEENDMAEYKIRRTWAVVHIGKDDLIECAKRIMSTDEFRDLQAKHPTAFLTEKEMLEDFENERIEKFKNHYPNSAEETNENHIAIISTTLKSSKGDKVTFSIHPARTVVGKVIYSYQM